MSNFRPIDRDTGFLLPPSVDEWLPQRHLARFVVEVIDGLDLSAMTGATGLGIGVLPSGAAAGLLIYGYATGVFSSRKLERATYDWVAFRFIAANEHPDHDTIATFRRRFLPQIEGCSCRCWSWRARWGCSSWARWRWMAPRSTPMPAAQRAVVWACGQDRGAVEGRSGRVAGQAEAADAADVPDGMSIPDELARREERLASSPRPRRRSRRGRRSAERSRPIRGEAGGTEAKAAATGKKPRAASRRSPGGGRCRRIRSI